MSLSVLQLSIRSPSETEDGPGGDKEQDSTLSTGFDPAWLKLDVSNDTLFRWTENLRIVSGNGMLVVDRKGIQTLIKCKCHRGTDKKERMKLVN